MTNPQTPAPGGVVFLGVVATLWLVGAIWSAATMLPDVTGMFLCGIGTTVAIAAAAIVHQVAQRQAASVVS